MKHFTFIIMITFCAVSAQAGDVGVSISVDQPGFYGRVDIGNAPQPELIYPQPVVIRPQRGHVEPLYLHVPPGHAKNWSKHCSKYNACNQPVYFVQDRWYNDVYVPKHQGKGHGGKGKDKGDRGHGKGHDKD